MNVTRAPHTPGERPAAGVHQPAQARGLLLLLLLLLSSSSSSSCAVVVVGGVDAVARCRRIVGVISVLLLVPVDHAAPWLAVLSPSGSNPMRAP